MRVWDDEVNRYIEVEVVWNGRDSLTEDEGWLQRHPPIVGLDAQAKQTHTTQDQARKVKAKADVAFSRRRTPGTEPHTKCQDCGLPFNGRQIAMRYRTCPQRQGCKAVGPKLADEVAA